MASFGVDYSAQFRRNEMKKNLELDSSAQRNVFPRFTDWCSSQLPADASICTVPPKRPQFMTQKNLMLQQDQEKKSSNSNQRYPEPHMAIHPGPTHHPGGPPEVYRRPPHSDMIQRKNQNSDQSNFLRELKNNSRKPLNTDNSMNTIDRRKNRFVKCQSMNVDPGFNFLKKPQEPTSNQRLSDKERSVERGEFPLPVPKSPLNYENVGTDEFYEKLNRHRNLSQNSKKENDTMKNYYADPLNISLWADKGRYEVEGFNYVYPVSPNNSDEIVYQFQNKNDINSSANGNQNAAFSDYTQVHLQNQEMNQSALPSTNQTAPYVAIVAPDLESLQNLLAKNFNGMNLQILTPQNIQANSSSNNLLYPGNYTNTPSYYGSQSNFNPSNRQSPVLFEFDESFEVLNHHLNIPPISYERIRPKITPKNLTPRPFTFQPEVLLSMSKPIPVNRSEKLSMERQLPTVRRSRKLEHSFSTDPKPQEKVLKYQHVREPKKIDTNVFINAINQNKSEPSNMNKPRDFSQNLTSKEELETTNIHENDTKKSSHSLPIQAKIVPKRSPDYQPKETSNDTSIVSVAERAKMWSSNKNETNRRKSHGAVQSQTNGNFQIHNLDFDSDEMGDENPMSVEDRIQLLKLSTKNQEATKSSPFSPEKIYQKPEQVLYSEVKQNENTTKHSDSLKKILNSTNAQDFNHVSRVNKTAYAQRHQINGQNTFQKAKSTTRHTENTNNPYKNNNNFTQTNTAHNFMNRNGSFFGNKNPHHHPNLNQSASHHHTYNAHQMRRKTQPITLEDLEMANQYILDGNESDIFDAISVSCQPEESDIFNLVDGQSEVA